MWAGLGADSGRTREPTGDINTAVADSLKALDPKRPIREADMAYDPAETCLKRACASCDICERALPNAYCLGALNWLPSSSM